jgi:hypothetical protein
MTVRVPARVLLIETAQIWYDGAKNPTPDCPATVGLHNALNHTENALIAILDGDRALEDRLRERLKTLRKR